MRDYRSGQRGLDCPVETGCYVWVVTLDCQCLRRPKVVEVGDYIPYKRKSGMMRKMVQISRRPSLEIVYSDDQMTFLKQEVNQV